MRKKITLLAFALCMFAMSLFSQTSLYLDYDAIESSYYGTPNATDTTRYYLWGLNKNLPNDSLLTMRWATVRYDNIVDWDYANGAPITVFPKASTTVRLDSFDVLYFHERVNTASTDTVYFYVYDLSTATITGTGVNAVFSATWLWKDSIKVTGANTINGSGTNLGNGLYQITRRPNLTLPLGHTFGIYVEFRGNKANDFQLIASYRDACNDACQAEPAFVDSNSAYYLNYKVNATTNLSGIFFGTDVGGLYFDCDASGAITAGGCEYFPLQNWIIPAYVTANPAAAGSAPTVVTTAATSVTSATATLNGTVNANNASSTVSFEYGLTTSYGTTVAGTPSPVTGNTTTAVSASISGLAANTTYHFRVKATNTNGTSNGNDLTFTTQAASGACNPNAGTTSGLEPKSANVNCITKGSPFSQTYTFVVPSGITQPVAVTVNSMKIDSIVNLPTGLSWQANQNPALYNGGQSGCFIVTGTTNAPCGQYTMKIYVTLNTTLGSFSGELTQMATTYGVTGFEQEYLRVVASGDPCPTVNTSPASSYVAYAQCGASGLSVTISKTNVNCFGGSTGSATATATGGTTYTYAWSNGGSSATISNLPAGNYTVTVTSGAATATATVDVTQPASAVSVSATSTQTSCSSNTGSATASASGGTAGYTYSWSNGGSGATISNLAAGTYSVTATDTKGCTASASTTVSSPAAFTLSVNTTNINCYGAATGSATANVSGASGNVTYSWNTGATTSSITNLVAGTYTVTVTDGSGCSKNATGTVTQPANPLTVSVSTTNSTCGATTGSATATVSNNNGSPTYSWSNGGSSATLTNLAANVYTVTVTAGGCTATATGAVSNSNGPALNVLHTDPTCFGSTNGSATVVATGGTAPYTYQWNTGATGSSLNSIGAGTYTIIVTDNGGCLATSVVTLVQPNAITFNPTVTNVNCNGATSGAVSLSVAGGTGPYQYTWSNGSSSSSITNVAAGNYTVTVTDSKSCTAVNTSSVTQPTALSVSATSTGSTGTNGTASSSATGGTTPYSYSWSNGQTTSGISGLAPGNYNVTVTDGNGCSASANTNVANLVGIEETQNIVGNVSLFPNPANDMINVVVEIANTHAIQMTVTDIAGKVVLKQVETATGKLTTPISVKEFTAGIYIVEISAGDQAIRKRFVVAH
ncbi:MAG: T9SS type A sorting domain-containing protein [Chitinophagales bacterium]